MNSDEDLLNEAREAREASYAPYSGFRVGAVLEADDGRTFAGCNVENAAYPATVCAERVALGAAVAAGIREFRRVAIYCSGNEPAPPCGVCRQALSEFSPDLIVVAGCTGGAIDRWTLADLLPRPFRLAAQRQDGTPSRPRAAGRGGA